MSGHGRLARPGGLGPPVGTAGSRGRLSGPGDLPGQDDGGAIATAPVFEGILPGETATEFAARHGLTPSAARPTVLAYLQALWHRRHFIWGFATARNVAMYTDARLGQLWQVLTPLLNAAVYYLVFGVLLGTRRGVYNFIPFLVTGVFVFTYTQRSLLVSSRVINKSLPLIRALYFPRACLPLGYILIELQQLLVSYGVLIVIVLATGEPLTWYWLLTLPVLTLQTLFNLGAGLILARVGAGFADVSQLLPFILRTWLYTSGVLFSIQTLAKLAGHHLLSYVLQINPAAIYITLTRNSLMASERKSVPGAAPYNQHLCTLFYHDPNKYPFDSAHCAALVSNTGLWLYAAGWAVVALVAGFFFFWRAEARYGRG